LAHYKEASKALKELEEYQVNASKELDYNSFLLEELEAAPLQPGIQTALEEEYEQLSNVETIMELLSQSHQLLNQEQIGLLEGLSSLQHATKKLENFGKQYVSLNQRVQSMAIEMADMATELERLQDGAEADPVRLEEVNGQLQLLHTLMKKHQANTIEDLMAVRDVLAAKVDVTINLESKIKAKQQEVFSIGQELNTIATTIRKNRNAIIPKLKAMLQEKLALLGMPSASFKIEISAAEHFKSNGKDELTFLFSANKGSEFGQLKKVASGGELSRIMLTIKSILAQYEQLPTLIFDEIDTGVSGEISNKMGDIMQGMSQNMQVFSITHLPQVASKGQQQFKVFKEEVGNNTRTGIKLLSEVERVNELAEMLGGKSITDSALAHAKQLLQ
jgi:DNA repair protein RecN (Recombination protein N)